MGKLIRNGIEYGGGNGTDIYEVTQAQYNTLKQAGTLVRNALYVITDAENLNCTASDIEYSTGVSVKDELDDKADTSSLATVATSGSYNDLSNTPSLATVATSGSYSDLSNKPAIFRNTLGLDVLSVMKDLPDNCICFYAYSNQPPNRPPNSDWGSYYIYKTDGRAKAYYHDSDRLAISSIVTSSSTTISWYLFPTYKYKTSIANNLQFYRKGDIVYFAITNGSFTTNANGIIVIDGSTSVIPTGYRPVANCQMMETNLGYRMTANVDGVLWCVKTSTSNLVLRVSGCWITNDTMPS